MLNLRNYISDHFRHFRALIALKMVAAPPSARTASLPSRDCFAALILSDPHITKVGRAVLTFPDTVPKRHIAAGVFRHLKLVVG